MLADVCEFYDCEDCESLCLEIVEVRIVLHKVEAVFVEYFKEMCF